MKKILRWLFGTNNGTKIDKNDNIHSITCGERDKDGFAYAYINGEKTNIKLLLFDRKDIEHLQNISENIYKKNE